MEKIKKAIFEKWVQKCNWFKFSEGSSANGRQDTYLTPSGSLLVVTYDLESNLFTVGILGPPPQQPQSMPGFPGSKDFPFLGGKK